MSSAIEPIIRYKMSEQETRVYKIGLLWIKLSQEILPGEDHYRYPLKGDPRQSHLFRVCWKFSRESRGIIKDSEVYLFIRAQLELLKNIRYSDKSHAMIDPNCLCGNKAWIRWKIWLKKYQVKQAESLNKAPRVRSPLIKIASDLDRTSRYIRQFYPDGIDPKEVSSMFENGVLRRWMAMGKISPYYALLSPTIREKSPKEGYWSFDLSPYIEDIDNDAQRVFFSYFPEEKKAIDKNS